MLKAPSWAQSMARATPGAGESAVCGGPSQCHFGLLFCEGMGLIQPLAFLSTAPGLSYPCLAAHIHQRQLPLWHVLSTVLLTVRLCFPASSAISVGALEGMKPLGYKNHPLVPVELKSYVRPGCGGREGRAGDRPAVWFLPLSLQTP